ncbi:ABC transporter substrate-binding protein [Sagittula salina]|uniref:Carbohydrate ABC transporter substrate-binding protein n=1 Tax=Sagittula salina TaxID=2820268 RepID=A0A940MPU1_9RHOB|nr:ABC transporter substrate-binding protein [Sagittula salina]MBP0482513.1 carbohydrate ABC transporter substrate-binding protein [Sagittula salina]
MIRTRANARAALLATVAMGTMVIGGTACAVDLGMMLSDVDGKAAIIQEFAERYEEKHPDVTITLNAVGYDVLRDQLPLQLEAGTGPDLAFVTNLGGMHPYYVDLTPQVDADAWEAAYGAVLPWYRAGTDGGIYGFHTEMTVTGPYVNLTMFEEAGVDLPGPGATWEDWAEATRAVMEATGSYAGMVMDRSGHRFAGPAMSYGAKYFDGEGHLVVDDGYRAFAQLMLDWHDSGLMPPDIWPAVSGSKYANGNELFFNSETPFYMSGSWNTSNVQANVGDKFDWSVVPVPCGPAGCGVMPGGTGLVALKSGDAEAEAAAAGFVAWMAEEEQAREWYSRTFAIPANAALQKDGLDYETAGAAPQVSEALKAFTAMAADAAEQTPQAYDLQGLQFGFVMYNATVQYLSAAMNDELTLDEALDKISEELETNAR